jgi:radical SAM superfamily enzyme YgiQ (UPF0313 family)
MSWKIIEKYRRILYSENGATPKNWGGKLPVCLVYPNRYHTAMSNLGFQAVYAILNAQPDILCERAFLPDPEDLKEYAKSRTQLLSLESQRTLSDFAVIAFSVSFESDYLNIPLILSLAGIPPFASERDDTRPLIMAGGAALFLNPEPVAELMDLVCVGEAEEILSPLLAVLREKGLERKGVLERAATLPGIYVPAFYEVSYDGLRVEAIHNLPGAPSRVTRVWSRELDRHVTASEIFTPDTEFSDMHLIELSRGCPRGCRFCAAGFIYRPYRQRSLAKVKEEVMRALAKHKKLGLVGAAVSDFHGIGELCQYIIEHGGKVSVSSLRIDGLDNDLVNALKASGHKTVALAPEGGSQRLRDLIKKDIDEEQILSACDRLIDNDILNLKLYFIIGLPSETMTDLEEMVSLIVGVRERVVAAAKAKGRLGEVTLSINPFVPKPFTPFQWCGMEEVKSLEGKIKFLQQTVGRLANLRLISESPRDAYLQALLSRGDRRLAALLVRAAELGNWRKGAKEIGLNTDQLVYREIQLDETLPWDVIDSGDREYLLKEYRKAFPLIGER